MSAAEEEAEVVFCRNSGIGDNEDDWDDSALIAAYDRAVGGIYKQLDKRNSESSKKKLSWKKGQFCRAQFSEDGVWYEAKIIAIEKNTCTVQFVGYLNEEEQPLNALKPSQGNEKRQQQIKEAKALKEFEKQIAEDEDDDDDDEDQSDRTPAKEARTEETQKIADPQQASTSSARQQEQQQAPRRKRGAFESAGGIAFPPPPPPFPPGIDEICGSDDALAAMLMSWYISGYHTGFYQAMRQHGNP